MQAKYIKAFIASLVVAFTSVLISLIWAGNCLTLGLNWQEQARVFLSAYWRVNRRPGR